MAGLRTVLRVSALIVAIVLMGSCSSSSINDNSVSGGQGGADASSGGSAGAGTAGTAGAGGGSAGAAGSRLVEAGQPCRGPDDQATCAIQPDGSFPDIPCPEYGHIVEFTCVDAINDHFEFLNQTNGRTYWCEVEVDPPANPYDCKADPKVGDTHAIESLGVSAPCWCSQVGSIGWTGCTYSCKVL